MDIINNMLDMVGNTPIKKIGLDLGACNKNIWAKMEHLNPTGSIKDRVAVSIVQAAEADGSLTKNKTILEASSGNMAIALSFVANAKGYKTKVIIPNAVAQEKLTMLQRYGAVTVVHDVVEKEVTSLHGASIEIPGRVMCRDLELEDPTLLWVRQFSNKNNYKVQEAIADEILQQIPGKIAAFVASIGTGGTLYGIGRVLKRAYPDIKIFAVEPAECKYMTFNNYHEIPGITGGIIIEIARSGLVDDVIKITDVEAIAMTHRLLREEGVYVGVSSGANILAAARIANQFDENANIVTVFPDRYDRYLSSEHYTT